jgi:hypothetical protein
MDILTSKSLRPSSNNVRARLRWIALASLGLGLAVVACDSTGGTGTPTLDCSPTEDGTVPFACDCRGLATGEPGACGERLCRVSNDAFCEGNEVEIDCTSLNQSDAVDVCGVPVAAPEVAGELLELTRSQDVKEFSGSGPVDASCFAAESFPDPPGTSRDVPIKGIAKIFKNGCQSTELTIQVYTVKRTGDADDGDLDELKSEIVTPGDCTNDMVGVSEDVDLCTDLRWECKIEGLIVPTDTELVIKTSGDKWKDLYEYNVYFSSADIFQDPDDNDADKVEKDVRALAKEDYPVIAQAALGKTITNGNGAVAGEVHDCGDVRLINALVNINKPAFELTYFGDDEDDPLPSLDAKASGRTALYAALDVEPGRVAIAATGVLDGELVAIGYVQARVFADAVTSVTFRGLRPFQVPGQ